MPTYHYTIKFTDHDHHEKEVIDLFRKILKMMNLAEVDIKCELIAEEGGTDELINICDTCFQCGKDIHGQTFYDDTCKCRECRDNEVSGRGNKEFDEYVNSLVKKGIRYDDILGEVSK